MLVSTTVLHKESLNYDGWIYKKTSYEVEKRTCKGHVIVPPPKYLIKFFLKTIEGNILNCKHSPFYNHLRIEVHLVTIEDT